MRRVNNVCGHNCSITRLTKCDSQRSHQNGAGAAVAKRPPPSPSPSPSPLPQPPPPPPDPMERTPSAPAVANGHASPSPSPSPSPRKRRRSERDDKNDADSPDALLAVQPGQKAPVDTSSAERAVHSLLLALGEDPSRPGLDSTPRRVALMFSELLSGYRVDATALLNGAIFNEAATDAVHIRGIRFSSLCEHHMLTFSGRVHVAYIPDGRVIGLSKVPRIVRMFAQRLQLQERLTRQIAHFLNAVLRPRGVAVIVEGRHLCASIRGVRSTDSTMLTSVMLGDFRTDAALREQLWSLFRTPSGADLF